jgi:hypothetical protein
VLSLMLCDPMTVLSKRAVLAAAGAAVGTPVHRIELTHEQPCHWATLYDRSWQRYASASDRLEQRDRTNLVDRWTCCIEASGAHLVGAPLDESLPFQEEDVVRHTGLTLAATAGVLVIALAKSPGAFATPGQANRAGAQKSMITIPRSLEAEHEEIHAALLEATRVPGRIGAAAKELAAVLDPHFQRENQIALPPLGLLAPLAAGETPAGLQEALAMSDALRKELPRMLEEHKRIRAATEKLGAAAREAKASAQEQFAERLAAHARTEEEILYPAAILVGDVIRARTAKK